MFFIISGHHIGGTASYRASTVDNINFCCTLRCFTGKTLYDKVPYKIVLYRGRGIWKSDEKIYAELTKTLGHSIDEYMKAIILKDCQGKGTVDDAAPYWSQHHSH
jgi:hypothetical protein